MGKRPAGTDGRARKRESKKTTRGRKLFLGGEQMSTGQLWSDFKKETTRRQKKKEKEGRKKKTLGAKLFQ